MPDKFRRCTTMSATLNAYPRSPVSCKINNLEKLRIESATSRGFEPLDYGVAGGIYPPEWE
jgi:hypothetical protein